MQAQKEHLISLKKQFGNYNPDYNTASPFGIKYEDLKLYLLDKEIEKEREKEVEKYIQAEVEKRLKELTLDIEKKVDEEVKNLFK